MNLLLFAEHEVAAGCVVLRDRRARHLIEQLKVSPGQKVRAAIINQGPVETAVAELGEGNVTLALGKRWSTARPELRVSLAIPRPKALSRILQTLSSFGVGDISLFNAWKVEKSYLKSPRLHPDRLKEDLLLGCEQGRQCHLPRIELLTRFTDWKQELGPAGESRSADKGALRVALDPGGDQQFSRILGQPQRLQHRSDVGGSPAHSPPDDLHLCFGPDGGFVAKELASLQELGFHLCALNCGPLRTEVAIAATLGIASSSPLYRASHLPECEQLNQSACSSLGDEDDIAQ